MISVEPVLDDGDGASAATEVGHGGEARAGALVPEAASHSVARGALALFSTQPVTWAISLLSAILVPRFLGDRDLGTYVIVLTIASFLGTFASIGVPNYLVRRVATRPRDAEVDGGAALVLLTATSMVLAMLVAIVAFVSGIGARFGPVLYVGLAGAVLLAPTNVVFSLLNGQERHARFAWYNVLAVAIPTCAGLAVLVIWHDLLLLVTVMSILSLPILIVSWRSSGFRLRRSAFDFRHWRRLTRSGLPFFGANVTLRIRAESDRLLIAALATAAAVGWYGAAYRIISIPLFIPTLIVTPLLPALSRTIEYPNEFRQTFRRCVIAALALSLPIFAMLFALAPAIPGLLGWPQEFERSVPIMLILAIQQPIVALDMVLGTALIAMHRERRWLVVMAIAATLNVGLNLLLITGFTHGGGNGALGAAIATVITECLILVGAFLLLPRHLLDGHTIWICGRIVLAGLILIVVTRLLMPLSVVIALPAGGAAFIVAALGLGIARVADAQRLLRLGQVHLWGRLGRRATPAPDQV